MTKLNKKEIKTKKDELKQKYINEVISTVFKENMRKYFNNTISQIVELKNGSLVCFDKPKIETRFCFGYNELDHEDYENTQNACSNFTESGFLNENLKELYHNLKLLKNENIYIIRQYPSYNTLCKDWINEKTLNDYYSNVESIKLDEDDIKILIEAQKEEIEKFKKRLNVYLKKYGTSKLRTWTYSVND